MTEMFDRLLPTQGMQLVPSLLAMGVALVVGHIVAWVYIWTHMGLSYSRSFAASLVVLPMIVALMMTLLQENLAIAFGMLGILAVVRFRNVLKDTRDTVYIFITIVLGMAAGTQRHGVALVGALVLAGVMLYLRFTSFGTRHRYDVVLSFHWTRGIDALENLRDLLRRHAARTQVASQRSAEADRGVDVSYRLLLRDPDRSGELVEELKAVPGISHVSLFRREDESEI